MKTIVLIHGWNYKNYYHLINNSAWENRKLFVDSLKKKYNIITLDLPGFGLSKEPSKKCFTLEDYAKYVYDYIKNNHLKVDYLLGYSFGGAVALKYKQLFDNEIKLILVSPAIIRNEKKSRHFIKTPKCLDFIRNYLRDLYLIRILKVNEMVYGTKFLRNTYQNIVRVSTLDILKEIDYKDIVIIYGEDDDMVRPKKVYELVDDNLKGQIKMIKGGGHDIANSHTLKLIGIISEFIN